MAKLKKFRLKKKYRRLLFRLFILIVGIFLLCKGISTYKYHRTNEYKLLQIGYTLKEANQIESKLSDKEVKELIAEESKDEDVLELVYEKYFMDKNYEAYKDFYHKNKDESWKDIVALVNVGAYREHYKDMKETDTSKGILMLVNKYNALSPDYTPKSIKTFSSTYSYGEVKADEECYNAFIKMADAAKKDGITLILTSGYRSNQRQEEIYMEMRNTNGKIYADSYAARPGSSEHETGLALDIFTYSATTENFEKTDTYKWLIKNSYKYGFIRRYEEGKAAITGYKPESWHFRYLGVDMAKKVYEEGITYDEYYAFYLDK